jgi:hypothetical protein
LTIFVWVRVEGLGMRGRVFVSILAAALAAALVLGDCAAAASRNNAKPVAKEREQTVMLMSGMIGPGSYREFRRFLRKNQPDLIVLEGPGGVLGEAILIADEVHRRGIPTAVRPNAHCASGCAIIFLAGRSKYMGKGAKVGLHSASFLDGEMDPEATDVMAAYLAQVGVPLNTLRRMAMTAPDKIRWISRSEQKAMGIKLLK